MVTNRINVKISNYFSSFLIIVWRRYQVINWSEKQLIRRINDSKWALYSFLKKVYIEKSMEIQN